MKKQILQFKKGDEFNMEQYILLLNKIPTRGHVKEKQGHLDSMSDQIATQNFEIIIKNYRNKVD